MSPRHRFAWLAFLSTILAGWLAAHVLGHSIAPHPTAGLHAGPGQEGYLATIPALAFAIALLTVGMVSRTMLFSRTLGAPSPALVLVPPAGFLLQEYLERCLQAGHFAHGHAVTEPALLLCFLLQAPFALVAYLGVKALLGCAEALARWKAAAARFHAQAVPLLTVPIGFAPEPTALLSSGHGQRGPPLAA